MDKRIVLPCFTKSQITIVAYESIITHNQLWFNIYYRSTTELVLYLSFAMSLHRQRSCHIFHLVLAKNLRKQQIFGLLKKF
jgi:hypothetical protein